MDEYVPSEYVKKYFNYLMFERKLSDNTVLSYNNDLKDLDIYFNGDLLNVTYDQLIKYFASFNKLSARSLAHHITVVSSFYNFLLYLHYSQEITVPISSPFKTLIKFSLSLKLITKMSLFASIQSFIHLRSITLISGLSKTSW